MRNYVFMFNATDKTLICWSFGTSLESQTCVCAARKPDFRKQKQTWAHPACVPCLPTGIFITGRGNSYNNSLSSESANKTLGPETNTKHVCTAALRAQHKGPCVTLQSRVAMTTKHCALFGRPNYMLVIHRPTLLVSDVWHNHGQSRRTYADTPEQPKDTVTRYMYVCVVHSADSNEGNWRRSECLRVMANTHKTLVGSPQWKMQFERRESNITIHNISGIDFGGLGRGFRTGL
jgi:hypothetical protein